MIKYHEDSSIESVDRYPVKIIIYYIYKINVYNI